MALRRCRTTENNLLDYIPKGITMLPNTSGARNAEVMVLKNCNGRKRKRTPHAIRNLNDMRRPSYDWPEVAKRCACGLPDREQRVPPPFSREASSVRAVLPRRSSLETGGADAVRICLSGIMDWELNCSTKVTKKRKKTNRNRFLFDYFRSEWNA